MALLTADDVLNKKFQPTKFREGYDQDEVDDFLDEVVNTLRAVYAENEELKARLAGGQSGEVPAVQEPVSQETPVVDQEPEPEPEPEAEEAPEQQDEATAYAAAEPETASFSAPVANEPESATGMLQLAQRLHDEYVNDGKAEADRILTEAREESARLTGEAEELRNRTLNQLEEERTTLERKIDELRGFERDYRARLKSYLEGLLRDVEGPAPAGDPLGRGPGSGGYDLR